MADLSSDILFDAAIRLQLLRRSVEITFGTGDRISFRFPNTRMLADFLGIPHYLILRSFALLEKEDLVTRAERVGIITTPAGSRMMVTIMQEKYAQEAESILGQDFFTELTRKTRY